MTDYIEPHATRMDQRGKVIIIIIIMMMTNNNNNNNNNNNRIQWSSSNFFFAISSQRHELSPTSQWPGRNRVQPVQHFERLSRATCYEGTAQLLSLTEFKSHLFQLYFIGLTINQ